LSQSWWYVSCFSPSIFFWLRKKIAMKFEVANKWWWLFLLMAGETNRLLNMAHAFQKNAIHRDRCGVASGEQVTCGLMAILKSLVLKHNPALGAAADHSTTENFSKGAYCSV